MMSAVAYAETPPEGSSWFRVNALRGEGEAGVSFFDIATWNQYSTTNTKGAWADISMEVLPWNLPWSSTTTINLKADFSTVNVDSAFGSADNVMNVSIEGFYNSTLNINNDFYISGRIAQDGNANLNIAKGATVSVSGIGDFASTTIDGAGTTVNVAGNWASGKTLSATSGATLNVLNNGTFSLQGTSSLDGATLNGKLQFQNSTDSKIKDSTLNVSADAIRSNGNVAVELDNTVSQHWTGTGWKDVMFFNSGNATQQTITLKNGTKVNGAGSSDGVSYWDMDPETRSYSTLTSGGNTNFGWDKFTDPNGFLTINLESGAKYATNSFEFANAGARNSEMGAITVNMSGTNLTDGYTELAARGNINIRLSSVRDSQFATALNMNGNSHIESTSSINLGAHDDSKGGTATFSISGANNTVNINDININSGRNSTDTNGKVNFIFASDSSASTVTVRGNINNYVNGEGVNTMVLDGTNNTLYSNNNLNMLSNVFTSEGTVAFKMLGEGNTLNVYTINLTNGDNSTNGNISVVFNGSNAENKNNVILRNSEFVIEGATVADSKFSVNYEFAGNTVLRGRGTDGVEGSAGVWLKLHEWGGKQYTTNSTLTIKGTGNDILLTGLEIGKTTGGGTGTFRIEGAGNRIVLNAANGTVRNGLKIDNGGRLQYAINDSGISTLLVISDKTSTFTGKLNVDFSSMTRATSGADGWEKFDLLATTSSTNSFIGTWFTVDDDATAEDVFGGSYTYLILNEEYVSLINRSSTDEYVFILDESFEAEQELMTSLSIMYKSNVPEPATYAAIFGALALAFAIYCKKARKN